MRHGTRCAVFSTTPSVSQNATSIANCMRAVCTLRHGRSTNAPSDDARPSSPRRRAREGSASWTAARTSPSRTSQDIQGPSHVEADLEHVAVDDLVVLPLDAQLALLLRLGP